MTKDRIGPAEIEASCSNELQIVDFSSPGPAAWPPPLQSSSVVAAVSSKVINAPWIMQKIFPWAKRTLKIKAQNLALVRLETGHSWRYVQHMCKRSTQFQIILAKTCQQDALLSATGIVFQVRNFESDAATPPLRLTIGFFATAMASRTG